MPGLFKKEEFSHIPKDVRPIMKLAFPGGEKQLNQETKNRISHRGLALRDLLAELSLIE